MRKTKILVTSSLLFCALAATASCENGQERKNRVLSERAEEKAQEANMILDKMIYFRDPRADLCFVAGNMATWVSGMMANVPCEKVQHLLVNPEK